MKNYASSDVINYQLIYIFFSFFKFLYAALRVVYRFSHKKIASLVLHLFCFDYTKKFSR